MLGKGGREGRVLSCFLFACPVVCSDGAVCEMGPNEILGYVAWAKIRKKSLVCAAVDRRFKGAVPDCFRAPPQISTNENPPAPTSAQRLAT